MPLIRRDLCLLLGWCLVLGIGVFSGLVHVEFVTKVEYKQYFAMVFSLKELPCKILSLMCGFYVIALLWLLNF
jgi:hypothetical protein